MDTNLSEHAGGPLTLVIGATGTIGSQVARELRERGASVRAFVRDAPRAMAALGEGIELAVGDLHDVTSLTAALAGAERVFLCTPNHPLQAERETAVIAAAADAGVRRVVKLSANGARIGSPLQFWDAHASIEEHLRLSGLPAVVLRPSSYTSNLLASAAAIAQMGRLFAPAADAKITLIDPRDVAAVAAVVILEDGHEGRTYTLTGPEAVTYHDAARQLAAAIDRPVEYVNIPEVAARDAMLRAGLPQWTAEQLLILWNELRRGAAATTTDVVRVLTGREPRTVTDYARDHIAAFRS